VRQALEGLPAPGEIAALQERARRNPRDPKALSALAIAYVQEYRRTQDPSYLSKAAGLTRKARALDPDDGLALLAGGIVANTQHRFARGLELGRAARDALPYATEPLGLIADSLIELGHYRRAEAVIQDMVSMRPDLASYSRASYISELFGRTRPAVGALRAALASVPVTSPEAAWVRSQLGDLYVNLGRPSPALEMYADALALVPGFAPAEAGRARVLAARGQRERSIDLLSRLVERFPSVPYAAELAELLVAEGRTGEAEGIVDLIDAQRRLLEASGVLPDVELTLFYADRSIAPAATLRLARAQYRARPSSIRTQDALAWALSAAGRHGEALALIKRALRLGTRDPLLHYHAGVIADRAGKDRVADRHLRRALSLSRWFSAVKVERARELLRR
jgi:tetratricopeptide (TPR) repeat protein